MNRTCLRCNASLEGMRSVAKYCSKTCKSQASGARSYGRQRGEDIPLIDYRKPRPACPVCGETVEHVQRLYCSSSCAEIGRANKATQRANQRKALVHVPADQVTPYRWQTKRVWKQTPTPSQRRIISGPCNECGTNFTALHYGSQANQRFCSPLCTKRAHRRNHEHKRRVRIRSQRKDLIINRQVFMRDGYICQLCGEPTNPQADNIANDYPSLDHIIALANGGSHTLDNVQTAHRICNSLKRDLYVA